MSRELVERFPEFAPIPLGTPVEEVERFLGKADKVLGPVESPLGFEYDRRGVWIAGEDGLVTSISYLTGTPPRHGVAFPDTLPGGLRVTDPPARALELYGPPDRTQELDLPRPPGARLSLHFYDLERLDAIVTLGVRSDRPDRLERVVYAGRGTPPGA